MIAFRILLLALQFALIPPMIDFGLRRAWVEMFTVAGIAVTSAYINLAIGLARNWRQTHVRD